MTKVSAIIVAAGQGTRMRRTIPKQYLLVGGKPLIGHALAVFDALPIIGQVVLVIPPTDFDLCREMITQLHLTKHPKLIGGGAKRQESVYRGLQGLAMNDDDIVVIHDGVRPLITPAMLTDCIEAARATGACSVGVPAYDTLKRVDENGFVVQTYDRASIWQVHTPQGFRLGIIRQAHQYALENDFIGTDDASLVEYWGGTVKMIHGSRLNIKITTEEDLIMAEAYLGANRFSDPNRKSKE